MLPADSAESVVEFSHRVAATVVVAADRAARLPRLPAPARAPAAGPRLASPPASSCSPRPRSAASRSRRASRTSSSPPTSALAMLLLGLLFVLRRGAEQHRAAAPAAVARAAAARVRHRGPGAGDDRRRRLRRRHRVPRHADQPLVGAHAACGPGWNTAQFPGCNGQGPLSFGQSRLADIQLTHRLFMYLAAISVIAMAALALRRRAPSRAFWIAPADPRRPDRARRDQRLGRQARRADHRPPGARHHPLGDRRLRDRDPAAASRPAARASLGPGPDAARRPPPDGERDDNARPVDARSPLAGAPALLGSRAHRARDVRDYIALTKPRIISLLLLTTVATMIVADPRAPADLDGALDDARRLPGRGRRRRDQPLPRPRPRRPHGPHPRPAAGRRADRAPPRPGLRDRARRPRRPCSWRSP